MPTGFAVFGDSTFLKRGVDRLFFAVLQLLEVHDGSICVGVESGKSIYSQSDRSCPSQAG